MIPLRFHIVSLIGVFLALAIGIVVGSTVVDRAIVEGLENRIETVSENLDRRQQANDELRAEVDRLERFVERAAGHAVEGRLTGQAVAILAARGVDDGPLEETAILLQEAGALAPSIIWMEPRWALDEADARQRLAESLGIPFGSPDAMRARAWRLVVEQLADPQPLGTESTVPPAVEQPPAEEPVAQTGAAPVDALGVLVANGFLTPEPVGTGGPATDALPGEVDRLLLAGTPGTAVGGAAVIVPMAGVAVEEGLPVLVAEVDGDRTTGDDEPPAHESPVLAVRTDEQLDARVATVDHLGQATGRVAATLALRDLGASIAGHYGFADGADEVVPERASR